MTRRMTAGAIALALAGPAHAEITASLYAGGGIERTFPAAAGWFFTPNSDLIVTQLGLLDLGDPGFGEGHQIGVFRASDASALVTASIDAGLSGELIDGSRFVGVAATMLTAGERYYIVADNFGVDQFAFGDGVVTFAPEITWNGHGNAQTNDIFEPVANLGGFPGNLGPNFRFVVVPAPGAGVGLVAGVAMLARRRR